MLNLWSSGGNSHLVAADFDDHPIADDDFEPLVMLLRQRFSPEQAIVARSASGKVKVFFLIVLPNGQKMEFGIAKQVISATFRHDEQLLSCIDLSLAALKITYLSDGLIESLHSGLKILQPFYSPLSVGHHNPFTSASKTTAPPFKSYRGELGHLGIETPSSESHEAVLRILLAMPGLLRPSGYALPTGKLGIDAGYSRQRGSQVRRDYTLNGYLCLHDSHYAPKGRAQIFRASGELRAALLKLYPDYDINSTTAAIPSSIPDGKWNEELGKIIGRLFAAGRNREEALIAVTKIPGSDKKDRLQQADAWYDWYVSSK